MDVRMANVYGRDDTYRRPGPGIRNQMPSTIPREGAKSNNLVA
jgi:hypothetical protein